MKTLHFTFGPVQSFVEQARRTRDLWAGSFLLSYLCGQAMKVVLEGGGNIVFPAVGSKDEPQDPLLKAILGNTSVLPQVGSLPNRFKAQVPKGFDPYACKAAIESSWSDMAAAVWDRYIAEVSNLGHASKSIWDSQVQSYWDISWVMGSGADDHTWIGRRKNFRTHHPPAQEGDHCTLMGDWQEISGYSYVRDRGKRQVFWDELRSQLNLLDLGDGERLCAIALIKRLYPRIAKQIIGWDLDVKHWPSTSYMAAVPWIERAVTSKHRDAASAYLKTIESMKLEWVFSEHNSGLPCLRDAGKVASLDGKYFHLSALENDKELPLEDDLRKVLIEKLKELNAKVGPVSSFYSLLLMDGDRLGAMLQAKGSGKSEEDIQKEVSSALSVFTSEVENIVSEKCGKTIYAGGDDVLAILPVNQSIPTAIELRKKYRRAFKENPRATISAAIVFAHHNLSLRAVLKEAHHQLDEVAKDENGRDSVAVCVLAGSGRTVQWVSTWTNSEDSTIVLEDIARVQDDFSDKQFSSKFIYNIRQRLGPLMDQHGQMIESLNVPKLLEAEYQKNREQLEDRKDVEQIISRLWNVCQKHKRIEISPGKYEAHSDKQSLMIDGALLVRFLSRQEVAHENIRTTPT